MTRQRALVAALAAAVVAMASIPLTGPVGALIGSCVLLVALSLGIPPDEAPDLDIAAAADVRIHLPAVKAHPSPGDPPPIRWHEGAAHAVRLPPGTEVVAAWTGRRWSVRCRTPLPPERLTTPTPPAAPWLADVDRARWAVAVIRGRLADPHAPPVVIIDRDTGRWEPCHVASLPRGAVLAYTPAGWRWEQQTVRIAAYTNREPIGRTHPCTQRSEPN